MKNYPFDRRVENARIKLSVLETMVYKATRAFNINIAKFLWAETLPIENIVRLSKLTREEVEAIGRGEDIDKDEKDE